MKRLNYFLVGLVTLGSMVFTSCDPTETDPIGPSITFKADGIIADATINSGEKANFSWEAIKGDASLAEFTIRINNQDVEGFPITDIDKDEYQATWDTTLSDEGDYTFAFIIEDKDGMTDTKNITITVLPGLSDYGTAQLGAGGSSLGSYYSIADSTVYKLAEAKLNASKLDFVFSSTASEASFKSPKDASATEISSTGRTTYYQIIDKNYDDVTTADVNDANPNADNIVVALNDVILFKNADNKKGVFVVDQLAVATDGTITIAIKLK
ncbi:MAG: hypothetical protein JXA77_05760 [Bacteroidales bacterium]|nr:hypothetical protein [Bacteroidales bacterium]MBN2820998.1 hypothetical protein [Bacteroidales bacterium]